MASIEPISGHNDRVILREVLPLQTPFTLNVFPTNACNFKCHYCAQSVGAKKIKEYNGFSVNEYMSIDVFEKILIQSKKFKEPYKLLSFMGHGEPLLNKQLPQMVRLAKEANIAKRIEIITNGSLLSNKLSDELISAGITNVRVSLQGLTSKMYYEVSKYKIDFEKFLDNLRYFHEKGEKSGSNLYVKILDCALQKDEEAKFYAMFDGICTRMYIEQVKPVYDSVASTKDMDNLDIDRYGKAHERRVVCPLAFFSLAVWPNGDVAPCDAIYKPLVLGNVHKKTLTNMFSADEVTKFRLKLLKGEKNKMFGCSKCCAPDDVSHEKDTLDSSKEELYDKYKKIMENR